MAIAATLRLALVSAALIALPVLWALPEELPLWRSLGILTGWIGCGSLLASLLFMVRESWLAKGLGGLEGMYRWHHRLGVVAYVALLLHPLALAADGWNEMPAFAWASLAPWQQSWPVWLGWASLLALMTGLATTFSQRLAYGTWRSLHWLLAAAVVLGFGHLLLLGLDTSLLGAPLLAIAFITWRALRSDLGLGARPYVVSRVAHPAQAMVEVTLRPLARPARAEPGQFVLVAFAEGPRFRGCGEYHPFTISGLGDEGQISLAIKALGDCTRHLQAVEPGVAVRLQGPFGDFLANSSGMPALWVAGGIGITPFLAALRHGSLPHPVRLLYFHRDAADAAYREELATLVRERPGLSLSEVASVDDLPDLSACLPAAAELAGLGCHLCGPPGLIDSAIRILQERGVPPAHIHFERFDFR